MANLHTRSGGLIMWVSKQPTLDQDPCRPISASPYYIVWHKSYIEDE